MLDIIQKHFDELYEDKAINVGGFTSSLDVVESYIVLLEDIVRSCVTEEQLDKYFDEIVR